MAIRIMIPRHHPVVKAVATALRNHCHVQPGNHLLVAVSGGADSVALLRALHILAPTRPWRLNLTVAHIQHHLRPAPQAQGDARFVARLAEKLLLPYVRADLNPALWNGNIEACARNARYHALIQLAQQTGSRNIITAHHADDQLETLLMRLLRGTSIQGLRGIAWRRTLLQSSNDSTNRLPHDASRESSTSVNLIRPLLQIDHAQLLDFLRTLKQRWREDATNRDTTRWRARLRADVLPVLRELRPDAARHSTHLADHLRQVHRLSQRVCQQAFTLVTWQPEQATLSRQLARSWSSIVLMDVLRRCLQKLGVPGDTLGHRTLTPLIKAIRDHTGGTRCFAFQNQVSVTVTRDQVAFTAAPMRSAL